MSIGLLGWVAVGLVAGLLARAIMGGGERKGCIVTVILLAIGRAIR